MSSRHLNKIEVYYFKNEGLGRDGHGYYSDAILPNMRILSFNYALCSFANKIVFASGGVDFFEEEGWIASRVVEKINLELNVWEEA